MIEMELKAYANEKAIKNIEEKGDFLEKQHQRDIYLNHPEKDFGETDEALRLRKINNKSYLTYKGPRLNARSKSRVEIEEEVGDMEKSQLILENLGFTKAGLVEKERKKYKIKDYELTIDEVKNLGKFIELEKEVKELDDEMMDKAIAFLKKIGIDKEDLETKSYLELLMEKKK